MTDNALRFLAQLTVAVLVTAVHLGATSRPTGRGDIRAVDLDEARPGAGGSPPVLADVPFAAGSPPILAGAPTAAGHPPVAGPPPAAVPPPVPGEVLVAWAPDAGPATRRAVAVAAGGTVHDVGLSALGVELLRFDRARFGPAPAGDGQAAGDAERFAAAWVAHRPGVRWAEPNHRYALSQAPVTPGDPYFVQQPGLRRQGFPSAWAMGRGAGVRVAILDSGVDCRHPDLAGGCDRGFDHLRRVPTTGAGNGDAHGHGTHVASVACAGTDNGVGIAGAGWGCRVADHRVADAEGMVDVAGAARALVLLADDPDHAAGVANMSFGGPSASRTLEAAIAHADDAGVTLVAAAGNDGTGRANYPCAYPAVLCVGAVDAAGQRAWFSNTGHHAVAAVGVAVPGASAGGDRFVQMSGTSQASPHVAGAVALIVAFLAERGERWSPARIRQLVIGTAEDLGAAGADPLYGHGIVRPDLALRRLAKLATPVPAASVTPSSTAAATSSSTAAATTAASATVDPDARAVVIRPPAGAAGWVVSSQPDRGFFDAESHLWSGVHRGDRYHGVLRLSLDDLPPGARVRSAVLELTGLADQMAGSGQWSVALLPDLPDVAPGTMAYRDIGPLAPEGRLTPIVGPGSLGVGRVNAFAFEPAHVVLLQSRLSLGRSLVVRIDGPAVGGETNLFAWDTGFGSASRFGGPRLTVRFTVPRDDPGNVPIPTSTPAPPYASPTAGPAATNPAIPTPTAATVPVATIEATPTTALRPSDMPPPAPSPNLVATLRVLETQVAGTATVAAEATARAPLRFHVAVPLALRWAVKPEACWACRARRPSRTPVSSDSL